MAMYYLGDGDWVENGVDDPSIHPVDSGYWKEDEDDDPDWQERDRLYLENLARERGEVLVKK